LSTVPVPESSGGRTAMVATLGRKSEIGTDPVDRVSRE